MIHDHQELGFEHSITGDTLSFIELTEEDALGINGGGKARRWLKRNFKKLGRKIKRGFKWDHITKVGKKVSKFGFIGGIIGGVLIGAGKIGKAIDGDSHVLRN